MPVAKPVRVRPSVQPLSEPSMIAKTTPVTATSDSRAPTRSSRGRSSSIDVGTTSSVPTRASVARTTLRAKKEFHEKNSRRMPLPNKPSTAPAPATPTQTPIAFGRSPEDHQPRGQQPPTAEAITQRTSEQQQSGEYHGVGVDDPGDLGLRRAGFSRQVRQGDVHTADGRHHRHQGNR